MSSSVHIDNKKKDILIFCKALTQRLDDATLTAKEEYSKKFSTLQRKFINEVFIMEVTVFYLLMLQKKSI